MSDTARAETIQEEVTPPEVVEPVEVLADELDLEVNVVDDTPPEDQRPPRADGTEEDDDLDEGQFGQRIRKRIVKLRYEWNEERRA